MDSEHFDHLLDSIKSGPVVVFLGAGINFGIIPLWGSLLNKLLDYALDVRFGSKYDQDLLDKVRKEMTGQQPFLSIYEQANLVKVLLDKQYLVVLRSILYEDYNRDPDGMAKPPANNGFLASITRLCNSERVTAAVNYNYDDVLLSSLQGPNRRGAYAICGPKQTVNKGNALPIYYVHGYLPNIMRAPDPDHAKIVLSLDEYFHNMMEPYSWQTTTQMHFLLNATCIFLGASLEDINMLRMLRYSKHYSQRRQAYALMALPSLQSEGVRKLLASGGEQSGDLQRMLLRSKATLLADAGIKLITTKEFSGLADTVDKITKALRRKTA